MAPLSAHQRTDLPIIHPVHLGMALSYSVFFYEILDEPQKALDLARSTFHEALAQFDDVAEDDSKGRNLSLERCRAHSC